MTKRKGTKKPTGGAVGHHSSARKRAEKPRKPAEIARRESAVDTFDKLAPRKGGLQTSAESRAILMIYFKLVGDGISPNQAAIKVSLFGSFMDSLS